MEENIYTKQCLKCDKIYIGKNKDLYGICQECEVKDELKKSN